jgi:hypothetical protein
MMIKNPVKPENKLYIMGNGKMAKCMGMENIISRMAIYMTVLGKMGIEMDLEY